MSNNDPLATILTPELKNTPSVAGDVLASPSVVKEIGFSTSPSAVSAGLAGNINPDALVASHAIQGNALQTAAQSHPVTETHPGFWGRVGLDVSKGLNFLNKPLQTIQSNYRFLHAVYTDHGIGGLMLAGAPVVLGGIVGSFGGPEGTAFGIDAGSWVSKELLGNTIYQKQFAKAQNPNYTVSPGRDFSNLLAKASDALGAHGTAAELRNTDANIGIGTKFGVHEGSIGSYISGRVDGAVDYTFDPLSVVSKFSQVMREGSLIKVGTDGEIAWQIKAPLAKIAPQANEFIQSKLDNVAQAVSNRSLAPVTGDQADAIFNARNNITNGSAKNYGRALDNIVATANDSSLTKEQKVFAIQQNNKGIGPELADKLSGISDANAAHQTIKEGLYFNELNGQLGSLDTLPSRTLMRDKVYGPIQKVIRGDANLSQRETNIVSKLYKTFTNQVPWTIKEDSVTGKATISSKSVKFDDPKAPSIMYSYALATGSTHSWASQIAGEYAQAAIKGDVQLATHIKNNIFFDAMKSLGLPDDNKFVLAMHEKLGTSDQLPESSKNFGSNPLGDEYGNYTDNAGEQKIDGLFAHQTGAGPKELVSTKNKVYAFDTDGRQISKYMDANTGKQTTGELFSHQYAQELALPNLSVVKDIMSKAGYYSKWVSEDSDKNAALKAAMNYGVHPVAVAAKAFNQHALRPFIDNIFAPAALLTGGFALRVASGELFNAAIIHGAPNLIKNSATALFSKLGVRPLAEDAGELDHLTAAASVSLGGSEGIAKNALDKGFSTFDMKKGPLAKILPQSVKNAISKVLPEKQLQYANELLVANDGHITNDAVSAHGGGSILRSNQDSMHHFAQQEVVKNGSTEHASIAKKIEAIFKGSNKTIIGDQGYTGYTAKSPHYAPSYANTLNKTRLDAAGSNITKDILELTKNNTKLTFVRPADEKAAEFYTKYLGNNDLSVETRLEAVNRQYGTRYDNLNDAEKHVKVINDTFKDINVAKNVTISKDIVNELVNRERTRILLTKDGKYGPYAREAQFGTRWKDQNVNDFANQRVQAILGLYTGDDGTILKSLANKVAKNQIVNVKDINSIPEEIRPKNIPGRQTSSWPSGGKGLPGLMSHAINAGFNKVLDPIINTISREPLYLTHYAAQREKLEPMVQSGQLDLDQAVRISQYKATQAMIPNIHAPYIKSEFGLASRSVMPFYFAQEQAIKRAWRAAVATKAPVFGPLFGAYARRIQIVEQAMNNPTFITKDASGNKHIQIPAVGYFETALQGLGARLGLPFVPNLPTVVEGNLSSLKTALPGLNFPGVSPIVSIPLNEIKHFFPAIADPIDKVLGAGANQSLTSALIPNQPFLNVWKGLTGNEKDSAFANATVTTLVTAFYHGEVPPADATAYQQTTFINKIRNDVRTTMFFKAGLGLISPLAPSISQTDMGLTTAFTNLMKPVAQGGKGLTYPDAVRKFLAYYGDNAQAYTEGKNETLLPGENVIPTKEALDWINQEKTPDGLLGENSKIALGASYLIPQPVDKSLTLGTSAYQQLVIDSLRKTRSPQEMLTQLYIQQGWNDVAPEKDAYNAAKIANPNATASNNPELKQLYKAYTDVQAQVGRSNPIWAANSKPDDAIANAKTAIAQLQTIYADPKLIPNTNQAKLTSKIVNDYNLYSTQVQNLEHEGFSSSNELVKLQKNEWQAKLTAYKTSDPQLAGIINGVFRWL